IEISSACVIGYIGPATKPCSARAATNRPMLLARPHRKEATTNSAVAHTNNLRSPKCRVSQPVSGKAIALLTAKEVITHVAWFALPPRLPEIVGNETFAMVRSSTCMNDASARPSVVSGMLGGRKPACGRAPGSAVVADIGTCFDQPRRPRLARTI